MFNFWSWTVPKEIFQYIFNFFNNLFWYNYVRHKWTILDKANGFKTIILPSKVKFLMCHILKRFEYLILRLRIFFRVKLTIAWKMNSEILYGIYFKVNTFYTTDCHLDPLQGPNSSNFTLRKVWLKTRILRIIRKYIWS